MPDDPLRLSVFNWFTAGIGPALSRGIMSKFDTIEADLRTTSRPFHGSDIAAAVDSVLTDVVPWEGGDAAFGSTPTCGAPNRAAHEWIEDWRCCGNAAEIADAAANATAEIVEGEVEWTLPWAVFDDVSTNSIPSDAATSARAPAR